MEIKEEQVSEAEAAFEDEDEEEEERLRRLEAGESIEDIDKSVQRARQQSLHTTVLKVRAVAIRISVCYINVGLVSSPSIGSFHGCYPFRNCSSCSEQSLRSEKTRTFCQQCYSIYVP